ncbi:MAG: hypothetical protein NTU84_09010, partial [Verrucomicrobia bacterium]|nr:hypothetical protein [Verrucomicrobiota bacterium]
MPARLANELLEKKLALAYGGFTSGPNVTLAVSGGDHLYIQQVAKETQSLYYSNDSSFPVSNRTEVAGIDAFDTIRVVNGVVFTDDKAVLRNAPLYDSQSVEHPTRFLLGQANLRTYNRSSTDSRNPLKGTISAVQPDGTKSLWTFESALSQYSAYDYTNLKITEGIGHTKPAAPGYLFPTSVTLKDLPGFYWNNIENVERASLEVKWNHQPLLDSNVALESCTYDYYNGGYNYSNNGYYYYGSMYAGGQWSEPRVLPSAPQSDAQFQLVGMTGNATGGVVANALKGTISVPQYNATVSFRTLGEVLVFDDHPEVSRSNTIGLLRNTGGVGGVWLGVTGSVDLNTGVVSLTFGRYDELSTTVITSEGTYSIRSLASYAAPQDPGVVTLTATYSAYESQWAETKNNATVFAGQDIDARLDIDLSGLGSVIKIDSPVKMDSATGGEFVLRASSIDLNAPVVATNRLVLGGATRNNNAIHSQQGLAIATVGLSSNGKTLVVKAVVPVAGSEGYGYDVKNPPTLIIAPPQ